MKQLMFKHCFSLLLCAITVFHPSQAQIVLTDSLSSQTTLPAHCVRTYKNIAAYVSPLNFCLYYNDTATKCSAVSVNGNDGMFYDDGTGIYFVMPALLFINIYKLSANEQSLNYSLVWTSQNQGLPDFLTVAIDYRHRWMATGGRQNIAIFDIANMSNIVKTDQVTLPITIATNYYAHMISIRRNLVCQMAQSLGFLCYPVSNGKITGNASRFNNGIWTGSVQIYDDFVISCSNLGGIRIFSTSNLQLIGSVSGNCLDFTRSNVTVLYTNWWNSRVHAVSILNPASPTSVTSVASPGEANFLFVNLNGIFYGYGQTPGAGPGGNLRRITISNGESFDRFFAQSDYFGVGPIVNPLVLTGNVEYVLKKSEWMNLNLTVSDSCLPNDVVVKYSVLKTTSDYTLERLSQNNSWVRLTVGSEFLQTEINSQSVRVSFQPTANYFMVNMTQVISLRANNGRSSFMDVNLSVVRIMSPDDCRNGFECSGPIPSCMKGFYFDSTGMKCLECSVGYYKPFSGNSLCSICPTNSVCNSTSFFCPNSTQLFDQSCLCPSGYMKTSFEYVGCTECPLFAECNPASTIFTCSVSRLKTKTACLPCPENAKCDGTESFQCFPGFVLNSNGICVPLSTQSASGSRSAKPTTSVPTVIQSNNLNESWWILNPSIGIVLIICLWIFMLVLGFLAGFIMKIQGDKYRDSTPNTTITYRDRSTFNTVSRNRSSVTVGNRRSIHQQSVKRTVRSLR